MAAKTETTTKPIFGALYLELQEKGTTGRHKPVAPFTVSLGIDDRFLLLSSHGTTMGVDRSEVPEIIDRLKKIYRISTHKFVESTGAGITSIDYDKEFALDFLTGLSLPQGRIFLEGETRVELLSYLQDMENNVNK